MLPQLRDHYPFGEWKVAAEQADGITYTGRQLEVVKVFLNDPKILDIAVGKASSFLPRRASAWTELRHWRSPGTNPFWEVFSGF